MTSIKVPKEIQDLLTLNDRGNTLLYLESDMGFFAQVAPNQWFVMEHRLGNYPALHTFFVEAEPAEMRANVQKTYAHFYCAKNHLDLNLDDQGQVIGEEPW